eukprot:205912-Prorocentrum_minimum.AAC.1
MGPPRGKYALFPSAIGPPLVNMPLIGPPRGEYAPFPSAIGPPLVMKRLCASEGVNNARAALADGRPEEAQVSFPCVARRSAQVK